MQTCSFLLQAIHSPPVHQSVPSRPLGPKVGPQHMEHMAIGRVLAIATLFK